MTHVNATEQQIGPFSFDDAMRYIQTFALALSNLRLQDRFVIRPLPRPSGIERDGDEMDRHSGRPVYHVVLLDQRPDRPKPQGLTALCITTAAARGYAPARNPKYEAFDQRMTLTDWAKAVGVSRQTLKSRLDSGMTMEEAVSDIALRKAA